MGPKTSGLNNDEILRVDIASTQSPQVHWQAPAPQLYKLL